MEFSLRNDVKGAAIKREREKKRKRKRKREGVCGEGGVSEEAETPRDGPRRTGS